MHQCVDTAGVKVVGLEKSARADLEIVQVVRRVGSGGGVGGVAEALQHAFIGLSVRTSCITAETVGMGRRGGRLAEAWAIVSFSWRASPALQAARRRGAVVVVHGDVLGGDIYVDHGLHRALLARRPWLLLNPLHLFIAARETVRHRLETQVKIACLSASAEAALRRAHAVAARRPIARLRNGVDPARFRPCPERLDQPLDSQDVRLIFVGHEFGRKGLAHVLDAVARLPQGVRLEVLGGTDRARAQAVRRAQRLGLGARVVFLGAGADVAERLRRSDLLVLPSAWEAAPLVVLEAQASGVPVLLADAPWSGDLAGRGGVLTARPSGAALASAVLRVMQEPTRFAALRRAAVREAQGSSWTEVARDYIALAEQVRRARAAV